MNDAANISNPKLDNKLSIIKTKLPNVDENKLKSLEARFLGPSANGNLPCEYESAVDADFDFIRSKLSNRSEINSVNNDSHNGNLISKDLEENNEVLNENNIANGSNKSFIYNFNNSNNFQNNNQNIIQKNSARKKNESKKAEKKTKNLGGVNIDFLSTKRNRNDLLNSNNNNSNNDIREINSQSNDRKIELINNNSNRDKLNFENSKKQIGLSNQLQNNENISNINLNLNMNSPISNKAKKPLNTNSNNNLINISTLNPLNNIPNEGGINNNKKNQNPKENNKKEDKISPVNKTEKNGQSNNSANTSITNNLNNTSNLNNISNLNSVINIQNANFINTIQDMSYGSQSEENIEFSSKNICSSANLFYKNKDSGNNGINNKSNTSNLLKNQTILDQFNIKSITNANTTQRINDNKINNYFSKTSANSNTCNVNSNNTNNSSSFEDKNAKVLKQNYLKLLEDNEKLIKDLGDKNKHILEKDRENEKLKIILIENDQNLKSLNILNKNFENQINMGKNSLIRYLKDFEELKRTQNKIFLNEKAYKLGRFTIQRMGHRVIEAWEDGEEINNYKNSIKQIKETKEDLEKFKKRLATVIKKKETNKDTKEKNNEIIKDNNKDKNENSVNIPNTSLSFNNSSNTNNNFQHPMNIFHSNNLFSYGHNGNLEEYTEHEILELRELINFKLTRLSKEESECFEKLEKLEIEKIKYQIEYKRNMEEEKCRYGINSKEKWPVLSNRYLILSLLGKGGYSEVYKAYDLENHMEVACKIHQLNPAWSDSIKENYIRHTIRENQIHKEINHPKVVKHYDTIEIDTSSFCTVLELCSGPDLYTYLKLNKTLPEKDARIIISQILSGVEYLNKLQKKIIHYDLKPQNIIFNSMEVKISDFGLAKIMEDNTDKIELTSQGVGTYWYLPPECFDTDKNPPGISSKVDVWSIGVILFELVFGVRPFGHSLTQDRILKENVITNAKKVEFPQKPIVSEECKDFIKNCLAHNQDDRYDVFEALESNFIKGINPKKAKTN